MQHVVVLTGAGISAESGIETFRSSDGLWASHRVEDVATPEGWRRDPQRVLDFYAARREKIREASPNAAHLALAKLEQAGFRVTILTQNIDDLHERAGSGNVLHLHGNVMEVRSSVDHRLVYPVGEAGYITLGERCEMGSQLRPNVVWFGEQLPMLAHVYEPLAQADLLLVVGTSLRVMPVAGLIDEVPYLVPRIVVDPEADQITPEGLYALSENATIGVPQLVEHWMQEGRVSLLPHMV